MSPSRSLVLFLACAATGCAGTGGLTSGGSAPARGKSALAADCPTSPAPGLFTNAVCVCGDLQGVGRGLTTDSDAGAANVGVNGRTSVVGDYRVGGSFTSYVGLDGTGTLSVRDNVLTTGSVNSVARLDVGGDLSIGGDLGFVGELLVGGTLRVAGQEGFVGNAKVAARGPYIAPSGPPCGCDPSTFFDVAKAVAAAQQTNDNAKHGIPSVGVVGQQAVTLPTGTYYFSGVQSVGSETVTIDGAVAVAIDGDLQQVGEGTFKLTPGSTLDLYVSGNVQSVGTFSVGAGAAPGSVRVYIGGTSPVVVSVGNQQLNALVYAPSAQVQFVGDTEVVGALFAGSIQDVGALRVAYTAPAPPPPVCGGSDGGTVSPAPGVDAGTSPGGEDAGTPTGVVDGGAPQGGADGGSPQGNPDGGPLPT